MIVKGMLRFLAGLCASLLLAGCARTRPEAPGKSAPGAVELRTASVFGGSDPSAMDYQELIAKFMEKYPGVKVLDESSLSDESWKGKVLGDFASGNEPDVLFYFTGTDARAIIAKNKVVSLEEIRKEYPDYGGNLKPSAMEYMVEPNGKSYALPVRGIWEGLYCNRDLFEQHGITLPTDWTTFQAAVQGFSGSGIIPVAVSLSDVPHYWIENLILSAGGAREHAFEPVPGGGAQQYPDSWSEALIVLRSLYEKGAFAPDAAAITNAAAWQSFTRKEAAMILEGSWFLEGVEDQENTTVLPFPAMGESKGAGEAVSGYSMGFYITRRGWDNPEKRQAAIDFVREMTSDESVAVFARVAGSPAARVDLPRGLTPLAAAGFKLSESIERPVMPVDSRLTKRAWDKLYSSIPGIVSGSLGIDGVLSQVADLNE